MARTEQQIRDELAAAREKLARQGRTPPTTRPDPEEGRLQGNFDLPYSSMPKIYTTRWHDPNPIG